MPAWQPDLAALIAAEDQPCDVLGHSMGGKAAMAFFEMVKGFIKENAADEELNAQFLEPLKAARRTCRRGRRISWPRA